MTLHSKIIATDYSNGRFNSYCVWDSTTSQTTCMCPTQYSFIDEERKYKGCKPDFQTQSCDIDEAEASIRWVHLTPNLVPASMNTVTYSIKNRLDPTMGRFLFQIRTSLVLYPIKIRWFLLYTI
jgi:hypothetical protein